MENYKMFDSCLLREFSTADGRRVHLFLSESEFLNFKSAHPDGVVVSGSVMCNTRLKYYKFAIITPDTRPNL